MRQRQAKSNGTSVPTRVLTWYLATSAKGGTVDDCSRSLGLANQSVSGAVTRLTNAGKLSKTDLTRSTRLKRPAAVYVHSKFAKGPSNANKAEASRAEAAREARVLQLFRQYVEARKKAGKDERAIQRALMRLMKGLAVEAER